MSDLTTDRINIILQVNGASSYVNNMRQVTGSTDAFNASAGKLMATLSKFISAAVIFNFAKQSKEAWKVQLEAETKLNTILTRNLGATKDQVQAVKDWASELQKVGVIGDEIQLSGLQELSTYIESAESLKTMNVVLNDMLAQQYGLNATAENAVNIATMLGKVLNGQTSALSRYGYSFTEAQEQLIKFGTEEQKVATLAQVVETSVGGVNEALAKTPAGRLKQISNEYGDIKEQFGKAITNSMALFIPVLKGVANAFEYTSKIAVKISESSALAKAAQTVRLYGEAWKQASATTKGFVKAAVGVFAVGMAAPKIISMVDKAVKLLTIDTLTLGGAISAIAGIAGVLLMAKAFSDLSKSVEEMRKSTDTIQEISDIGSSAAVSSAAVGDLSEAMEDLGNAAEGLDTFLASFDEVNKVGGNKSLMSNLVNTDDLANILGVADGLGDIDDMVDTLDGSLDSLDMGTPSIDFLNLDWWEKKWDGVTGFLNTFFNGEWKENWNIGFDMIGEWFEEHFPEWTALWEYVGEYWADVLEPVRKKLETISEKFENSAWYKFFSGKVGANAYDWIHEDDEDKTGETFTYTTKNGQQREVLKYNADGSESELYKKYKHPEYYNEDNSYTELYKRLKKSGVFGYNTDNSELLKYNTDTIDTSLYKGYQVSQNKTVNQTSTTNNSSPVKVEVNPEIYIDSRKITSTVIDGINAITVSSGKSPLVE